METKSIHKKSFGLTLTLTLVQCLTFLFVETITFNGIAQTSYQDSTKYWLADTEYDPFWDPHCPFLTTVLIEGLNMWMFRQKMPLDAYQVILNSEVNLNDGQTNQIQFVNYLPFVRSGNFHSMIGTQYNKFVIQSDNDSLDKIIQVVWLWTAWQYNFKKWNISLTSENMYKGDENTLYAKPGNRAALYLYVGYEFNKHWDMILLGFYDRLQMVDDTKTTLLPGVQARYQHSNKFKLMFGLPILFSTEWTVLPKTDIEIAYYISNETHLFVRQRISNNFSISLHYSRLLNYSDETYYNNSIYISGNDNMVTFNKASGLNSKLFTTLDFKLLKDIGFSIGTGYNFSNKVTLYNNENKVYDGLKSKENFFINFNLQYLRTF